jgi:hypothetical protein
MQALSSFATSFVAATVLLAASYCYLKMALCARLNGLMTREALRVERRSLYLRIGLPFETLFFPAFTELLFRGPLIILFDTNDVGQSWSFDAAALISAVASAWYVSGARLKFGEFLQVCPEKFSLQEIPGLTRQYVEAEPLAMAWRRGQVFIIAFAAGGGAALFGVVLQSVTASVLVNLIFLPLIKLTVLATPSTDQQLFGKIEKSRVVRWFKARFSGGDTEYGGA